MAGNEIQTTLQSWFKSYAGELQRFFRSKVGEPDCADLMQEVYLRAFTSPSINRVTEPRAFLYKIASNLVVDHARKQSFRQHDDFDAIEEYALCDSLEPGDTLSGEQRLQTFSLALAELPEPQRKAFLLSRFEGWSHSEIAQLLQVSDKTVQRYVAHAFEHCLQRLEP